MDPTSGASQDQEIQEDKAKDKVEQMAAAVVSEPGVLPGLQEH